MQTFSIANLRVTAVRSSADRICYVLFPLDGFGQWIEQAAALRRVDSRNIGHGLGRRPHALARRRSAARQSRLQRQGSGNHYQFARQRLNRAFARIFPPEFP